MTTVTLELVSLSLRPVDEKVGQIIAAVFCANLFSNAFKHDAKVSSLWGCVVVYSLFVNKRFCF